MRNSSDFFFLHVDLHKMPPRTAESARFPPEAFELYARFPKYPISGSRDDQLAFIADMLGKEALFPQAVHDLWINFFDEYPICAPEQHQEDVMVKTMSMVLWINNARSFSEKASYFSSIFSNDSERIWNDCAICMHSQNGFV